MKKNGFSLIELMIVVAIMGILAMIAIPSYQTYTKRARFAEVIAAADIFRTAVSIAIQEGIELKKINNGINGIPESPDPGKNLTSITVKKGVITAIASEAVDSITYILKPSKDGSVWAVGGTCLKFGYCND